MTRETRMNLWFLVVFLAIAMPGAVMLFKKKLDPEARPMFMPDAVRRELVYMDPMPAPASVKRVVPEKTRRWVEDLARERGVAQVLMREGVPVMSEGRLFQVISLDQANGRVSLLVWNGAGEGDFELRGGVVERVERIATPEPIMREIQVKGYPKPPSNVVWIDAKHPLNTPQTPLVLSGRGAGARVEDSVVWGSQEPTSEIHSGAR